MLQSVAIGCEAIAIITLIYICYQQEKDISMLKHVTYNSIEGLTKLIDTITSEIEETSKKTTKGDK